MTPAARLAATIEILDEIARGDAPADDILSRWFRGHRFAGSGDRRAIRDLVYRDLRAGEFYRWALESAGGDPASPRARTIAAIVLDGDESPGAFLDGSKYGAPALDGDEEGMADRLRALDRDTAPIRVGANVPAPLFEIMTAQWGEAAADEARALNARAPVDLRVNTLRAKRDEVCARLAELGHAMEPTPFADTGLRSAPAANLDALAVFREGLVDPQDESSQLVAALVGARAGEAVIDYCAGAGGKTLALASAMENRGALVACDVSGARLARIAARASRLGVDCAGICEIAPGELPEGFEGNTDRVLVDAPCSGSGTWRRNPELRWRTDTAGIAEYVRMQTGILDAGSRLVRPGGRLVYAVCSLFDAEGRNRVEAFLAQNPSFRRVPVADCLGAEVADRLGGGEEMFLTPYRHGCDGMYACVMERIS